MFIKSLVTHAVAGTLTIVLLGTWVIPLTVLGQVPREGLTLVDAVEIALRRNPLTRATSAGRELASAELSEAQSRRLPALIATGSFTRSNNPVFVFGSLLEQGQFGPANFEINSLNHPDALNNFRSSLTLRFPVFDQRETETRIASARIRQQQADQQTNLVEQRIRFEVIKTYYGVLLAQAKLKVAEEAVRTAEADVKRARDLVESGVVVQSDLLAARVQLSQFRQEEIVALHVREGDTVRAGQTLIEIDNRDAGIQLQKTQAGMREVQDSLEEVERSIRAAESARAAAQANETLANTTYKRYEMLAERQSVSPQEFDEVRTRYDVARAENERADRLLQALSAREKQIRARIDQAKADVANARVYVGYSRIASPIDGVVVSRQADVGYMAMPGMPLLTIETAPAISFMRRWKNPSSEKSGSKIKLT